MIDLQSQSINIEEVFNFKFGRILWSIEVNFVMNVISVICNNKFSELNPVILKSFVGSFFSLKEV